MTAAARQPDPYRVFMKAIPLSLPLLLAACSFVPEYQRPALAMPAVWTGPSTGDAMVDSTWWRTFRSAELDALVTRSIGGNYDLKSAYARVEQARAKAQIAGSPLHPSVDLSATANVGTGPSNTSVQGLFVGARYELDFWGKNRAGASSAVALANASELDAQTVAVTLEASVANTYFEILSLQARLRLAQQIVDAAQHVLSLIEAQAASGIASDLEVQQQRNVLATFEAVVPALEEQRERQVHLLAVLIGDTPESFHVDGEDVMSLSIPQVGAGLPATVLQRRPDIRAAEARLISANFDIGKSRAAFLPSFTLTAQGGVVNTSLAKFFPPVALFDLVGGLVQPLFEGGSLSGQLRYDRAHAVELAAGYRQNVITALRDVEDALVAVQRLGELDKADAVAVESARRASELARARFEAGTADFLTVLTTERTWYQAEDAVLQVRLQRLQAAVAVFRALGGGFETQGGAL
jgi:NodT family efflux transporter outer membrane factor (OMF) lipoprotein